MFSLETSLLTASTIPLKEVQEKTFKEVNKVTNEEWNKILAKEIAKGLIKTGVEGAFDSVSKSTAFNYPSIGCSQWEGWRADELLLKISGGEKFVGRDYVDIRDSGELEDLKALLKSEEGQKAQLEQLSIDCLEYVEALQLVPTLDDTRCLIYSGIWCPTSTWVVQTFLTNRCSRYNLRSLSTLRDIFRDEYYISAGIGRAYKSGYAYRAEVTFQYVAGIDLTTPYGVSVYDGK